MEFFSLLDKFGLPGIFIGILVYIVKFQDKSNTDRETRFSQERDRWQQRDQDWFAKILSAFQDNTGMITKFASSLEQLNLNLAELGTVTRSNDEQTRAVHEYLQHLEPQIIELAQTVAKLIEEVFALRQHVPGLEAT
jgi:oligoendopeptidase F